MSETVSNSQQKMWAIGGGKGGVGKSIISLSLALWLAKLGKKVILVDADLGGANLHVLFGIRYPAATLDDFINKRAGSLKDILIDTQHENLKLISGADDILGLGNPKYAQKVRLLNNLQGLGADFILLDLGAGTSFNVLDFFLYCQGKIAVLTAQATSIQNVYGFIKSSLLRHLNREFHDDEVVSLLLRKFENPGEERIGSIPELKRTLRDLNEEKYRKFVDMLEHFKVKLILNMVKKDKDKEALKVIKAVSEKYLDVQLNELGFVPYDAEIERSVNRMVPFLLDSTNSQAALSTYQIAYELVKNGLKEPASRESGRENGQARRQTPNNFEAAVINP